MNTMNKAKENRGQMLTYIHNACAAIVLGASLSALLAACGGGGDGHTGAALSGTVLDGYIGGARVCLSTVATNSLTCDSTIPSASAVTDASGHYNISFPSGTSMAGRYVIAQIAAGNTDTDATSGIVQAAYSMVAPVETPSVVSPLTTMVSANMLIYPASGIAAAQASVASSVGIPAGSLASDYIANSNGGYHNVARLVAALLTTAGPAPTINQANVNALFTAANSGASAALNATNATQLNAAIATAQASYSAAGVGTVGNVTYATAFNTTTGLTTDGGTLGLYSFSGSGSSFSYTGTDPASAYWYGGYSFSTNPSNTEGVGIFVAAPGVIASGTDSGNGLTVNGATSLTIPLSVGTEVWSSTSHTMSLHVVAQGRFNKYNGNCTVLVYADIPVTAQPMTTYVIPVSSFTLGQEIAYALTPGQACGQAGITDVVSALADGVAEIHVQAIGANLNHNVVVSGGYPTGLTFGAPITFQGTTSVAAGTPGAPAYASAIAGNAQATVSFPASSSTGGSAILGYTVTSIPSGGVDSNAGTTALTHTITGLTNGTSYRFTVHATNATGSGSESAPSNAVTPSTSLHSLAVRTLDLAYTSTVKAINYSAYRAGGPGAGEIPTDAQINQDLALLNSAGYTLLRLFDTDPSHERILQLAATHPTYNMKFQLGIYLAGIAAPSVHPNDQASCIQTANDADVQNGIREANAYANVASISVGNETSFFSAYMPAHCLASYVTTVKQGTSVPVTADDDYTFYVGSGSNTIIPLLDFVSIHTYPMSNPTRWTYAGTGSAAAMMNAALVNATSSYTQVANYISAHGGAGLPIVIGETGWKAAVTNASNPLESCCANPVNAKMYFDSMNTWQAAGTGPTTIFYFEAFDEAWKLTDDGWGIWDATRAPRYALCGMYTGAPTCNGTLYSGAAFAP